MMIDRLIIMLIEVESLWAYTLVQYLLLNLVIITNMYRIVENIHKFRDFRAIWEGFIQEIWACHTGGYPPMIGFGIPWKFSPRNNHFLLIRESFLPRKFPAIRYYGHDIESNYWPSYKLKQYLCICYKPLDLNKMLLSHNMICFWLDRLWYNILCAQ